VWGKGQWAKEYSVKMGLKLRVFNVKPDDVLSTRLVGVQIHVISIVGAKQRGGLFGAECIIVPQSCDSPQFHCRRKIDR
jgi:hypothetical protein